MCQIRSSEVNLAQRKVTHPPKWILRTTELALKGSAASLRHRAWSFLKRSSHLLPKSKLSNNRTSCKHRRHLWEHSKSSQYQATVILSATMTTMSSRQLSSTVEIRVDSSLLTQSIQLRRLKRAHSNLVSVLALVIQQRAIMTKMKS